jgi:hypothetical protein
VEKHLKTDASYYFSNFGGIWGWATWRSEWERYDRQLRDWPKLRKEGMLSEIFDQPKVVKLWTKSFDEMHGNTGPNTWDIQWLYTYLKNNSLVIVPNVNLINNIGFGPGATHTTGADSRFTPPAATIEFPLRHPSSCVPLRSMDRRLQELHITPLSIRVARKIHRIFRRLFR